MHEGDEGTNDTAWMWEVGVRAARVKTMASNDLKVRLVQKRTRVTEHVIDFSHVSRLAICSTFSPMHK